ncbi:1226_t:CDS:2, partial [Dentiscutata erythropus]
MSFHRITDSFTLQYQSTFQIILRVATLRIHSLKSSPTISIPSAMKPVIFVLFSLIGTCCSYVINTGKASPELEERQWNGGLWKRDASPEAELEERQWNGGLWKRDASPEAELEERQWN